jgi:hypothetical protein
MILWQLEERAQMSCFTLSYLYSRDLKGLAGDIWRKAPGENSDFAICKIAIDCKITVNFAHFDPVLYTDNQSLTLIPATGG